MKKWKRPLAGSEPPLKSPRVPGRRLGVMQRGMATRATGRSKELGIRMKPRSVVIKKRRNRWRRKRNRRITREGEVRVPRVSLVILAELL